jgi:hypothetical protein
MYKKGHFWVLLLLIFSTLSACKEKSVSSDRNTTNLMKYGIACSINAPDDVTFTKIGSGSLADVSVKNQSGYDVQIFMGNAFTNDLTKLKQQKKEAIGANPFFVKIVEEYENGFLYEKTTEDGNRTYDFVVVKIMGDKEINFQCGNSKEFSEQEVKLMVKSVL